MLRFTNFLRRSATLAVIGIAISGCSQTTSDDLVPTQTVPVTAVQTEAAASAAPATSHPASVVPATQTPVPTSQPAILELGEPFWLGRGKVRNAAFLPGAEQLVIAWGSGVSLHRVESGEELWFQPVPTDLIAFDVQPQALAFAAALSDGSVMIFEASDGEARRFEGARPNAYWGDLAWSPDGQTVAFQFIGANRGDPIYLLDVGSGQISEVPGSQTGEGVGPALVWSPDSSAITVASLGWECSRFVDVHSGELRMTLGKPGECYPVRGLLFFSDEEMIAANPWTGELDWLHFPDGEAIRTLEGAENLLAGGLVEFPSVSGSLFADPSGKWIATRGGYEPCYCGNPDDQPYHPLIVWDLASGAVLAQLERAIDTLAERHRLAAAFDGEDILVFFESGEITRWRFVDPQAVDEVQATVPVRPVWPWTLRWSADGSHLAFTGGYGGVELYALATQQLVRRFDPPLDSPALSPDGGLIAVYETEQGAELIFDVQSGELVQTLPSTPVLMGASFSPDGRYLAYATNSNPVVTELESAETIILDTTAIAAVTAEMYVTRLVWSPDGQALVTMLSEGSPGSGGPGLIVLWQRQADGSFAAVYHVPNFRANYDTSNLVLAVFNPSGSRVALESLPQAEAGQIKLVVIELKTGNVIRTLDDYSLAAWMNDDELLAAEAQYYTRLTRINVVTGEMTVGNGRDTGANAYAPGGMFTAQMANPPVGGVTVRYWRSNAVIATGEHESLNLVDYGWSPDGRWLASVGDDGTLRVWSVTQTWLLGRAPDTESQSVYQLAYLRTSDNTTAGVTEIIAIQSDGSNRTLLLSEPMLIMNLVSSPDGKQIAFWGCPGSLSSDCSPGEDLDVWSVNWDGNNLRNLTEDSAQFDSHPDWSPDSQQIVFDSDRSGLAQLYLMNSDGSGVRQVTNGPESNREPKWSPDGNWIAYHCTQYRETGIETRICVISPDGQPAGESISGTTPVWSPGGTDDRARMAFLCFEAGHSDICAARADGSELVNLTNSPAADEHSPAWSFDGNWLAFVSNSGDDIDIYKVCATCPGGLVVVRLTDETSTAGWPAWSPDGSQVAYVAGQELMLVNADRSGATYLACGVFSPPIWRQ